MIKAPNKNKGYMNAILRSLYSFAKYFKGSSKNSVCHSEQSEESRNRMKKVFATFFRQFIIVISNFNNNKKLLKKYILLKLSFLRMQESLSGAVLEITPYAGMNQFEVFWQILNHNNHKNHSSDSNSVIISETKNQIFKGNTDSSFNSFPFIMTFFRCFIIFSIIFLSYNIGKSQVKGELPSETKVDSTFIFKSPRPLIEDSKMISSMSNAWGIDLLFSRSGFGLGAFLQKDIASNVTLFSSLYISGYRNTDELEIWNDTLYDYRVPGKVNRLFMFPLTIGMEYFPLKDIITDTFQPFISLGMGPTFIMSTPYQKEFFSAFGSAEFFTRFGLFFGAGATVGRIGETITTVNIRYYYIPFGGNGIASVENFPIFDFGGMFLSLGLGARF